MKMDEPTPMPKPSDDELPAENPVDMYVDAESPIDCAADDSAVDDIDPGDTPDDAVAGQTADPVASILLRVALALIITALATTAVMLFVVKGRQDAPRTAAERDVATWEAAVLQTPNSGINWAKLSYAYSSAGRYSEAVKAAVRGREVTGDASLYLPEADALRAARRYREAITAYDNAEKALTESLANAKMELQSKDIYVQLGDESEALVYYGRGVSEERLDELDAAIKDLRKAVEIAPDAAYMSVELGDVLLEAGDRAGARTAFRSALKYVPDYAEALAGLKKAEGR